MVDTKAKTKVSKAAAKAAKAPNAAIFSRISYLYQAATYLAAQHQHDPSQTCTGNSQQPTELIQRRQLEQVSINSIPLEPGARKLVSELRNVSGKVVIRMSSDMKRSICKNCDALLIDGVTCEVGTENKSRGGKKPWADVLVRRCKKCGYVKRYPLGERQKRRPHRSIKI
ncbi:RNAse P Rpr2/Rpp21/SNM1 subunit domain-containing protein [Calycina marina]|uniref:RNAse P Rpr2/Rpp21/SNM1 subunit domain-containing protein n=1 Tax=Calycina marina TaxID=1763456 RepID=A0A9P7ZB81_9HELO|nr:RNAse P Rpr2/Rpp21/SNM1 subunit domain-containing protein [Calycina marina]